MSRGGIQRAGEPAVPSEREITATWVLTRQDGRWLIAAVRTAAPDPSIERIIAPGEPLRCCLRYAAEGEQLILFNYEPPLPASPYREIGPVIVHAKPCAGPESTTSYSPKTRASRSFIRLVKSVGLVVRPGPPGNSVSH